jgi:hypothetical protein
MVRRQRLTKIQRVKLNHFEKMLQSAYDDLQELKNSSKWCWVQETELENKIDIYCNIILKLVFYDPVSPK